MQLSPIEDQFDHIEVITEGTYGIVLKGSDKRTGQLKAIKKYKPLSTQTENGLCVTLLREIALLKALKHPNIIEFERVFLDDKKQVYCVMPFYPRNLKKLSFASLANKVNDVRNIMKQVLQAVDFIHESCVIHRDLNPRNILIDDNLNVKICDFGLARLVFPGSTKDLTREVVTLNYRAPEIILGEINYTNTIDSWSIGCIFYELITGKQLFHSSEERGLLVEMCQTLGTPNELTWPNMSNYLDKSGVKLPKFEEAQNFKISLISSGLSREGVDFARKLLLWDPEKRMSVSNALKHSFFEERETDFV